MLPPRFDIRRHPAPRPPAALLLVLLVAAVFGGCRSGDPPAPARPDVLLITLDTLRADHTSAYGYARPTTPRLEEVARDGVRFAAAYAPMPTTLPSHASLMTGLLPRALGLLKNGIAFAHPAPTLAETLGASGYRTAAFVSSFVLDRSFGLARGFGTYDDHFVRDACKSYGQQWEGFKLEGGFCRRGAATREQAERWLEQNGYLGGTGATSGDASGTPPPYFLWIHLFDPHDPYEPFPAEAAMFPPLEKNPTDLQKQIAAYDGEIRYTDDHLGRIVATLRALDVLDDTIVVVTSDHGEEFFEHGLKGHGVALYDEVIRIPLVVRWPARIAGGQRVREQVRLGDLAPTILGLAGVPAPAGFAAPELRTPDRALDVSPWITANDGTERPALPAFSQTLIGLRHESVRTQGAKLIRRENPQSGKTRTMLYDLEADPLEKTDLAPRKPRPAFGPALQAMLAEWRAETGRQKELATKLVPAREQEERLRALGYIE